MSLKSLTQLFTLVQISEFTRKQGRITFVSPYEQSLFNYRAGAFGYNFSCKLFAEIFQAVVPENYFISTLSK